MLVLQPVLAIPESCSDLTTLWAGKTEERVSAREAANVPGALMLLCI